MVGPQKKEGMPAIECFSPEEKPYGFTYGEWTVRWWQWALSAPKAISPVLDETGRNAGVNQSGPVWFLAGTFGENKVPKRMCTIPSGKAILFPVITYEMNELEKPELRSESELIKHVVQDMDDIISKDATVDGERVPIYRVQSDPPIFSLSINDDDSIGIAGVHTQAAADGFWVFLRPLPPGERYIYFHGSCSGGIRNSTAKYHLTVEE